MGWGDAWAGLSQQAFGATVDILQQKEQRKYQTERDEMARRAAEQQEEARRKWEEKTLRLRASLDKEARREEQSFRSKESDKGRKFEAQQAAEQRGLTRSYYNQMNRNEQARLGLQREEMAQRQGLAQMRAGEAQGQSGPTANRVDTALMQEFNLIREKGDDEAKLAAGAIYSSNASPEEKLQRLRAIIGRMTQPTGPTGIQ